MFFRLDGKTPITCNREEWVKWYEKANRKVALDESDDGSIVVSTVFLGLDHGQPGNSLLFETNVFDDYESVEITRYGSWDEALEGHRAIAAKFLSK